MNNPRTIDPFNITNYDRTEEELQIFWLFCIMVAGKNAGQTADKLTEMLWDVPNYYMPFDWLKMQNVEDWCRRHRTGQYNRVSKAIEQSLSLNLRKCSLSDLEGIYGVGSKSARFFLLHSRKKVSCAVIDTHILKYLQTKTEEELPKSTPNKKLYLRLEKMFLECIGIDYPKKTVAEADLLIWKQYKGNKQ